MPRSRRSKHRVQTPRPTHAATRSSERPAPRGAAPKGAHLGTRLTELRAAHRAGARRAPVTERYSALKVAREAAARTRRGPVGSSAGAVGAVGFMVITVLIVAGSVLSPGSAATSGLKGGWRPPIRHWRHTVTATATVTVTARPVAPTATVTATKSVPGPTQTVTVTVAPTAGPTTGPTSAPTTGPTSAPPSTGTGDTGSPKVGIYMSGNGTGLDAYTSGWAAQPNVGSFYLNWNSKVPALMKTYASQGREIQAEISTKISAGSYVTWSDIAKGTYDDHLISMIQSLDALNTRVLLALDVEPDGQYNGGTGVAPGQTPAQYVAAANHVADLIHANSTHVESMVWLAGYQDAATEASFLPAHSKIDNIGWDPYKTGSHAVSETATQLFAKFINTVLVPYGYGDIPRHITETGIQTDASSSGSTFSTQTQIDFYQGIPAAMAADDIESVVWFRANSGTHHYIPTDSSVDQAFASMTDKLVD
ncbi:MAG: hypothetical protein QM747_08345 [Nocardioides sp.]